MVKHRQELNTILNADADQIIAVLSCNKLFTSAVKLAKRLKINIASILDNLAMACVRASEENSNVAWTWIRENDLADLPHKNSAVDMAWKLLERLIDENELEQSTMLRKSITTKLLSVGEYLPHWLQQSYKRTKPSELLHLYVTHGRLIEATDLAVEYICAMLSAGGEYYGLKNSLQSTMPPLCFPISTIDLLLNGLEVNAKLDREYDEYLQQLREVVNCYIKTVKRVSNDFINYHQSENVENVLKKKI